MNHQLPLSARTKFFSGFVLVKKSEDASVLHSRGLTRLASNSFAAISSVAAPASASLEQRERAGTSFSLYLVAEGGFLVEVMIESFSLLLKLRR